MESHVSYAQVVPYITKDGSEIRELMHPAVHGNRSQSLAEARIPVGAGTLLHRHGKSEELYHVTAGRGRMRLGERLFDVAAGDTVCIPPGVVHRIDILGDEVLVILCACSPAYDHDDTELLERE